jgi:hypothetical protein
MIITIKKLREKIKMYQVNQHKKLPFCIHLLSGLLVQERNQPQYHQPHWVVSWCCLTQPKIKDCLTSLILKFKSKLAVLFYN